MLPGNILALLAREAVNPRLLGLGVPYGIDGGDLGGRELEVEDGGVLGHARLVGVHSK